jgi:hypothetical protein
MPAIPMAERSTGIVFGLGAAKSAASVGTAIGPPA